MSKNVFGPSQDTPVIVVRTDASEFGSFLVESSIVVVSSTGKMAILLEPGQAQDSLNTTRHTILGYPNDKTPGFVIHTGVEKPGDIPAYNTTGAQQPQLTPSGYTVNDLQDLKLNQGILNDNLTKHLTDYTNPHQVNKVQLGLGDVDNTSDIAKPISAATQLALDSKANLTGDPTIPFNVGPATAPEHAAQWGQVSSLREGGLNYRGTWEINQQEYPGEGNNFTNPPDVFVTPNDVGFFWECKRLLGDVDKDGRKWAAGEWIVYNGGPPDAGTSWDKLNQSGTSTFKILTDTPDTYQGYGGKVVKVRIDETGIEFGAENVVEAVEYESYGSVGQTTIKLNEDVHSAAIYSLNGIIQSITSNEYTVSGDTITLPVPLQDGDRYKVTNFVNSPGVMRTEHLMMGGETWVRTNANQKISPSVTVSVNGIVNSWYSYQVNGINDYQLDFNTPFEKGDMVTITNYR